MPEKLIAAAKDVAGGFALDNNNSAGSVGAALLTSKGNIFSGICIDTSSGMGFCAEHSAIAEMLKNRESEIAMIVAIYERGAILPPCGRCRELMRQINTKNADTRVILGLDGACASLKELLPYSWE
jgi:cytidine deaminase